MKSISDLERGSVGSITITGNSHKEGFTMSAPVFEKDLTGLLVVDPYNDFISEGGILWPLVNTGLLRTAPPGPAAGG